jgi:hypothetical protein
VLDLPEAVSLAWCLHCQLALHGQGPARGLDIASREEGDHRFAPAEHFFSPEADYDDDTE